MKKLSNRDYIANYMQTKSVHIYLVTFCETWFLKFKRHFFSYRQHRLLLLPITRRHPS